MLRSTIEHTSKSITSINCIFTGISHVSLLGPLFFFGVKLAEKQNGVKYFSTFRVPALDKVNIKGDVLKVLRYNSSGIAVTVRLSDRR